jgi:hypothetical protein
MQYGFDPTTSSPPSPRPGTVPPEGTRPPLGPYETRYDVRYGYDGPPTPAVPRRPRARADGRRR